jgi:PST family polysaccharide transporter
MADLAVAAQPEPDQSFKAEEKSTYGQILKSTALVGGSQVVNIAMGIIRTKAMAMLLGPAGFGLAGLYMSIASLTQSIAGMGVNSSGVRQIAEAAGTGNEERIAQTAAVLRRTSVILGALGAVVLIVFSRQVSTLTFGTTEHAGAVALLSLVVFFSLVSAGQGALIQGMRRISDLAQMGVLGALYGTIVTIPIVYFLRQQGVVPSLVAVAALTLLTSWWYSRKVNVQARLLSTAEKRRETAGLLKLGFAFMSSSLMTMGSAYAIRIAILHHLGFAATGWYQSAWTLGGLYVGMILQAMGTDFYPRLSAVASNHERCNRIVNEQTRVGLLLAGPGTIATLVFAPVVIAVFYSVTFRPAIGILRWICLGTTLQVVTWPIGFIIVAKGEQTIFFWCEFAWSAVHIGLAWLLVNSRGAAGAGMAFFGSYIFHSLMLFPIVHYLTGFRWSRENLVTSATFFALIAVTLCGILALPTIWGVGVGVAALATSSIYSIRTLISLADLEQIPGAWTGLLRAVAARVRMARSQTRLFIG